MTEFDLVEQIILEIEQGRIFKKKFQSSRGFEILREVNLGYGIADLVIAKYNTINIKRKEVLERPAIKIYNIVNLSPGIKIDDVQDSTRISKYSLRKALASLVNEGLVIVNGNEIFRVNDYAEVVQSAIAIEAKLKDWRRALKQAYRYKWFAEISFVCLPESYIKSALTNLDEFKRYKVGLVQYSLDNSLDVIYKPRSQKPICQEMRLLLNELFVKQLMCFSKKKPTCLNDSHCFHRLNTLHIY